MSATASSRRYAQAVFEIAREKDELDGWLDDLTALASSLGNREFSELLDAPQVSVSQKTDLIKNTLGGTVGELASNLMCLLASRNIVYALPDIVEQYQRLLDAHRGIERADVVSAVSLGDSQRKKILELLEGFVRKDVRAVWQEDTQIIGGFVARVKWSVSWPIHPPSGPMENCACTGAKPPR
jgi:F-type H+-transporting ATPase subunit delta